MRRLVFDIETDNLLDNNPTVVHCLAVRDFDTGEAWSFTDASDAYPSIDEGLRLLETADELIGHNIICFDLPALEMIRGWKPKAHSHLVDTLNDSRLIWTNMKNLDFVKGRKKSYGVPARLYGSHSLEAWGYRLGVFKGEFGKTADWSVWTQEMHDYCVQDVVVSCKLFQTIEGRNYSKRARQLEYDFQQIIFKMERRGVGFNVEAAEKLYLGIAEKRDELQEKLVAMHPPFVEKKKLKTPSYYFVADTELFPELEGLKWRTKGEAPSGIRDRLVPGPPKVKITETPFNPGSRPQVIKVLMSLGWKPKKFTNSGQPQLSEDEIEAIDLPGVESDLLVSLKDFYRHKKMLGQLATGNKAWLKLQRGGRIYGSIITNGAVTGRCTHANPNLGQVPSVKKVKVVQPDGTKIEVGVRGSEGKWGIECRELFIPDEGLVMVGADASGLELRCLGHYLSFYDGGEWAKVLLEGDIHSVNQEAAGLKTRDQAKTFIYALIYGAGDEKLGSIVAPEASVEEKLRIGKRLRAKFYKRIPAIKKLMLAVQEKSQRGYLIGLDGRRLHVRSKHAALNTLLQSAGAIIMKGGGVIADRRFQEKGMDNYHMVLHVHDEYQYEVDESYPDEFGKTLVNAFTESGEYFNFKVPIAGEYKIGSSWAETH